MNGLEKLISELCPDGVEYLEIDKCVTKVDKINWKQSDGKKYQYIDLASVDRMTHYIYDTQTIDLYNAPSRAQQIVKTNDILLGSTRPMLD